MHRYDEKKIDVFPFQYTRLFLKFFGVWPMLQENQSRTSLFISKTIVFVCLLTITFTMLPPILHLFFREMNFFKKLMLIGPVTASLTGMIKYIILIVRVKAIKWCIKLMKDDWLAIETEADRAIMTRNAIVGQKITIICSLFLYSGGMSYHAIIPILRGSKINEYNFTIRPLVYPGYDIFVEPQATPTYEIIFILICISALVRYTVTITICNLAAVLVCHTCGQCEIVMLRLNMIFDGIENPYGTNMEIVGKRMSAIVQYHAKSLRFASKIDVALREILLIEVVAATLIICLLEYYCMTEWENSDTVAIITYFILLISYVFNIFIFCYIGELLKEQFKRIGKVGYMTEWYKLPGKNGLAIVMIMAMSNYPRNITAGRMMELSVCSFGIIIKTSVMYLNMIRAITD